MIASDPNQLKKEIPRAAVAEAVLQVLRNDNTVGHALAMSGGAQKIETAIAQFA